MNNKNGKVSQLNEYDTKARIVDLLNSTNEVCLRQVCSQCKMWTNVGKDCLYQMYAHVLYTNGVRFY